MILYCAERVGLCGMGGGVASQMEIEALAATGHPLTVICGQKDPHLGAPSCVLSERPIEWIVLDEYRSTQPPELSRAYLESQWRLIQLTRRIRSLKPDLIVSHSVSAHRRLEGYRSWAKIPRIMTLHGAPNFWTGVYTDGENKLRRVVNEVAVYDAIVVLGPVMAQQWSEQPGLDHTPMLVINNTVDERELAGIAKNARTAVRSRLGIADDVFALTCVASLQHRKGQDLLLGAMHDLMPRDPRLHLYLVGPAVMGWGGREILRAVKQHPFKSRIHIVGSVPSAEALQWVKASDCFVLPSRQEAMPLSILEAMYLGTPVVASDVNGIPDEIEDGVSGLLFSHTQPDGLKKAIVRMVEDEPFRTACAQAARRKYDEQFNMQLYMQRWKEIVVQYV